MAGPFSSANTAVDIQTGGLMAAQALPEIHAPKMPSAIADAAALVNAVAPPVNALMGEHYKTQLTQELKGVEAALAASRRPWAMDSLLSDEAAKDPIVSSAVKELKGMQTAVRRGQMPVDFAVDRMEQIISTAVSKVPAYEEELRAAGRNYLGFDPHQRMLSEMMQPNVQEQADQADAVAAAKIGMDINSYRQAKMQMFQIEFQKKSIDLQIASMNLQAKPGQLAMEQARFGQDVKQWQRGDVEWNQKQAGGLVVQHSNLESASITAQLLEGLQAQVKQGGVQDVAGMKTQATQAYNALLSAELSRLPPGADASGVTTLINQQREMAFTLIDSAAAGKITQGQNQYLEEIAKNNLYRLPKLGPVLAGLGPQQAPLVMATLGRLSKAGPGGYESVLTGGGEAGGVLTLAELLDAGAIERNMEGAVNYHFRDGSVEGMPESTRKVGIMLGIERLSTPGSVGTDYADGVQKLFELAGAKGGSIDEYYYGMIRPGVVANVSNSKETHGALLSTFTDDQAAIIQQYLSLVNSGQIPGGSVSLRDGKVVFPQNAPIQANTQSAPGTPSYMTQAQPGAVFMQAGAEQISVTSLRLAEHINGMLKFGDTYRSTGVIPATVYGGREEFVSKLLAAEQQMKASQEAAKQQQAAQQTQAPVVIKYQYVNGKLVRVQQ